MHRPLAALALVGALFVTACEDNVMSPRSGQRPSAVIYDGAHGAENTDVFFLPPLVPNPSAFFDARFNPNLSPVFEVCHAVNSTSGDCAGAPVARFGNVTGATGPISVGGDHYLALWHTGESNLPDGLYVIQVFYSAPGAGDEPVAWAHLQVVSSGRELKTIDNQTIGLLDGRTLPIRVRFETDCQSSNCASQIVTDAGNVDEPLVLPTGNGALVLQPGWLPPGITSIRVTLQRHETGEDNDCVGNAAFTGPGLVAQRAPCLEVTTDPVLVPGEATGIQRSAFIFLCTDSEESDPYHEFLEVIKADDGRPLQALADVAHARLIEFGFNPDCTPIEIGFESNPLLRLASRGWHAITRPVARLLEVKPLYAIDLGQGGEIPRLDAFSFFTLGVKASLAAVEGTPESAPAGSVVRLRADLRALNEHCGPEEEECEVGSAGLSGIDVTFTVSEGTGGLTDPNGEGETPASVITVQTGVSDGPAGIAEADLTVGSGTNVITAVALVDGGPVSLPVTFAVTGTAGDGIPLVTGLHYPKGLWIKNGFIYFTETAGRNTSFGGNIRLLRRAVGGSGFTLLVNNPVNSDAVVVDDAGSVYLTSYQGSIPGESGKVSVVQSTEAGWQETHLLDLNIASNDMFMDAIQDIYIIGESDAGADAQSLYRLPAGNYAAGATVVATGLGRAFSLTRVGSTTYYSVIDAGEVRSLPGRGLLFSGTVLSMTSDGVYLYYSEVVFSGNDVLNSWIKRRHLSTGVTETIATLQSAVNAVRYDPVSGNLYFLEAGTNAAQYRNGTLKFINIVPPIT